VVAVEEEEEEDEDEIKELEEEEEEERWRRRRREGGRERRKGAFILHLWGLDRTYATVDREGGKEGGGEGGRDERIHVDELFHLCSMSVVMLTLNLSPSLPPSLPPYRKYRVNGSRVEAAACQLLLPPSLPS